MEPQMGKTKGTSRSKDVSTKQLRIAELAKQAPEMRMDLSHHMDLDWFKEAYRRTRKGGAKGIDDRDGEEYGAKLEANLEQLITLVKGGRYKAPAIRRVYIPKGQGKQPRPIGIPTFEDKVLQRAVSMVLEPVYEQDFYDCSYGFRPQRSPHQAIQKLRDGLMSMGGGYVLDLDIRTYFDAVDHKILQELVGKRVRDGVIRRLIGKWLNAGVWENKQITYPEEGMPQGGVISPILSNIYLHEILDKWFHQVVLPKMKGRAFMVRFADDSVVVFENQDDAIRVKNVLPKRFAKYGLEINPEKTNLIRFVRSPKKGKGKRTFNFLGFTWYWGKTRKGYIVVKHKTAKDRLNRSIKKMSDWLRKVRHWPIAKQHKLISKKLVGHNNYYGLTGNSLSLNKFRRAVERLWKKWLGRRSYKAKKTWEWFKRILKRFPLPAPTPTHSLLRRAAKP